MADRYDRTKWNLSIQFIYQLILSSQDFKYKITYSAKLKFSWFIGQVKDAKLFLWETNFLS